MVWDGVVMVWGLCGDGVWMVWRWCVDGVVMVWGVCGDGGRERSSPVSLSPLGFPGELLAKRVTDVGARRHRLTAVFGGDCVLDYGTFSSDWGSSLGL